MTINLLQIQGMCNIRPQYKTKKGVKITERLTTFSEGQRVKSETFVFEDILWLNVHRTHRDPRICGVIYFTIEPCRDLDLRSRSFGPDPTNLVYRRQTIAFCSGL